MEEELLDNQKARNLKSKVRGVSDFIAIIRDRWLLSVALSLPISLGYVKYQDVEFYQSSSSFLLTPPPAVLNLQKVDRETHVRALIGKHTEGLNSQELRTRVYEKINNSSKEKAILLSPYMRDGNPVSVASTINYSIGRPSDASSRPRFIINSVSR
jgi:hypothetical protein